MLWMTNNFIFSIIPLLYLSLLIYRKYGLSTSLLALYCIGSGVLVGMGPVPIYSKFNDQISLSSLRGMILGISLLTFTFYMPTHVLNRCFSCIKYIAVLNGFLGCGVFPGLPCGMLNANSQDVAFSAMMLPFFLPGLKKKNHIDIIFILMILAGAIGARGSTAFVIMAVTIVAYYLNIKNFFKYSSAAGAVLALGILINKHSLGFWSTSNRMDVWSKILKLFFAYFHWMLGIGGGAYYFLGPILQAQVTDVFLFMHNDFIQIFIEYGLIGFFLTVSVLWDCLAKTRRNNMYRAAWIGLMADGLVQYPLRVGISLFYVFLLVRISLEFNQDEIDYVIY